MTGRLGKCLLLAYRTPAVSVEPLVPPGLTLMTRKGWAFWNIVACEVEQIRPAGLPSWCGLTYHHVAYRLYVSARFADGTVGNGLYFVRSDADSSLVSSAGNWVTDFKFHRSKIHLKDTENISLRVDSRDKIGGAELVAQAAVRYPTPDNVCFSSQQEREEVLKYKPKAFSPNANGRSVKIATVHRDESQWKEHPIQVRLARWDFLDGLDQRKLVLERATSVAPIDYRWSLGKIEDSILSTAHQGYPR